MTKSKYSEQSLVPIEEKKEECFPETVGYTIMALWNDMKASKIEIENAQPISCLQPKKLAPRKNQGMVPKAL
ncbi:hypothetical protein HHI36_013225, partial [Cryptolaemus montrouzieri]